MESPPARPAKTVLGRGLGNLLGAEATPATPVSPATEVPKAAPPLTPGVGALLRGGNGPATVATGGGVREDVVPPQPVATTVSPITPTILPPPGHSLKLPLLVADLLLLGLVGVLLLRGDGRPGILELALGLAAVGVGAWLGCLAFLSPRPRK